MTTEIHGHHANPMPKNQKAPAFLSAVRASLHTLANAACRRRDPTDVVATGCASRRAVTVPSSEQLHRAGQGADRRGGEDGTPLHAMLLCSVGRLHVSPFGEIENKLCFL